VHDHFSRGTVENYWGGQSNATTHLLEAMHYQGLLRVARRDSGIRIYAAHDHAPRGITSLDDQIDALVDVVVNIYAPLPAVSLSRVVGRLRYAVPQWHGRLKKALHRALARLSHARLDGIDWYWPAGERMPGREPEDIVRLLAPFDPVVWDRHRFELLWGWAYRFEAYTPAAKRKIGYYALPLLWGDRVIGWGNVSVKNGMLAADLGFVSSPPRARAFNRELEAELERLRIFLRVKDQG
jgi:uncharacterized protein YcaQ